MTSFRTRHSVNHSAADMFDLVADVESYPAFLPLCQALKIRTSLKENGNDILIADMTVAYKFLYETFTSKVTLNHADGQITVEYLDGPFHHLENKWGFVAMGERECLVDFFIDYRFRSRALQVLAGTVFDKAFRKFTAAFEKRADEIYGKAANPAVDR